jgi:hypothetical protein
MSGNPKWTRRQVPCKEAKGKSNLLIEWQEKDGKEIVHSIICDNPQLGDFHIWECGWSCWEKISEENKEKK